jgi:DNA-binding MurR/RpiR family transcriptional regulator
VGKIIAISDSALAPLAKSADAFFAVPEHRHTFSRSIAAPTCIAQALVLATAARLQDSAEPPEIPVVTKS